VTLGTNEEWVISAKKGTGVHPFHVHVNPFEVQENGRWVWRDTIWIPDNEERVVIRTHFADFAGLTVLHCHNLDHEDQGMMQAFEIVDPKKNQLRGLKDLPTAAPVWSLTNGDGKRVRLDDLAGKQMALVFVRGANCEHCLEQLRALATKRRQLSDAGISIVVVSPAPATDLARAMVKLGQPRESSFIFLSDEWFETFRSYGCYDRGPLHATFLIDSTGHICWQHVDETPYNDIDGLLRNAREAFTPRRR
jgi:peroxiredoxin